MKTLMLVFALALSANLSFAQALAPVAYLSFCNDCNEVSLISEIEENGDASSRIEIKLAPHFLLTTHESVFYILVEPAQFLYEFAVLRTSEGNFLFGVAGRPDYGVVFISLGHPDDEKKDIGGVTMRGNTLYIDGFAVTDIALFLNWEHLEATVKYQQSKN